MEKPSSTLDGKRMRGILLFVGLVCAAFAVLMAAGLFWEGGLDLPTNLNPSNWGARWIVVAGLTLGAVVLFLIQEFKNFKSFLVGIIVWGGAAMSYFAVGALVLNDRAGQAMGLVSNEAPARALGVVTVIFFLIAAVLVLKSETDTALRLTSIMSLRTSPGSTVILLWSLVIAYALGIIAGTALQATQDANRAFECDEKTKVNCVQKGVWPSYLILLAVPGAAAAAAKMSQDDETKTIGQLAERTLKAAKVRAQTELGAKGANQEVLEQSQELLEDASKTVLAGDPASTTAAISDIQYFVFNVFAMLFVLSSLVPYGRLPEIPELLLALTGASALVYTVNRHTIA